MLAVIVVVVELTPLVAEAVAVVQVQSVATIGH
jgi:hypothetical protein